MKKLLTLMLTLALALMLTACASNNESMYEQAQLYLGSREYHYAAELFEQLGEYGDSAEYALYAAALQALAEDDRPLARRTLETLGDFKSTRRYLAYLDAEQLADEGRIDEALTAFEQLGAFYRSTERAADMRGLRRRAALHEAETQLNAGNIEAAQTLIAPYALDDEAQSLLAECEDALQRRAYDAAQTLYTEGRYLEAYDAFTALGQVLDAPTRAQLCRSALYRQAEDAYAHVTLATSGELMALYDHLSGYLNADQRFETLAEAYGPRLALIGDADAHPYVAYGRAMTDENGAVLPVMWQVVHADTETATLVCCSGVSSRSAATPSDLTAALAVPEAPAEPALSIPTEHPLNIDALQTILSEPDALQTILTADDGLCARWLATLTDADAATLVACVPTSSGALCPVITIPMTTWPLTRGLGTWEDPYQ